MLVSVTVTAGTQTIQHTARARRRNSTTTPAIAATSVG